MAPVRMVIAKFGREVLIDDQHPLAIAQRAHDAAVLAAARSAALVTAPAPSPSGTQDAAPASLQSADPSAAPQSIPSGASVTELDDMPPKKRRRAK